MIKYFCDECGKEVPVPYCLYTLGCIICGECISKFIEKHKVNGFVVLPTHKNLWYIVEE